MHYKLGDKINISQGHVALVNVMGSDRTIDQHARGSFTGGEGSEERTDEQIRRLNRYLVRHGHTTPLESAKLCFHVKVPIFIWRQWVRHRTASISEKSGRYVLLDECYSPSVGDMRGQHASSKQASTDEPVKNAADQAANFDESCASSYNSYKSMVEAGVSKEQARAVLPLAMYTEAYWTIDLHNLMHFLRLRMDTKAQFQFREYAQVIYGLVMVFFPISMESFTEYKLFNMSLSATEQRLLSVFGSVEGLDSHLSLKEQKGEMAELQKKVNLLLYPSAMREHKESLLGSEVYYV